MSILSEIEYPEYLKSENDIVEYFKDEGHEYFNCGQGKFQDEVDLVIKINDDYYTVHIEALVLGAKQDRGDKLYHVEEITNVTYSKIAYEDFKEWSNTETIENIKKLKLKIKRLENQIIR